MARNERTPDQFDVIAAQLTEAAQVMTATAKLMRDGTMPTALVHGTTTLSTYLPSVLEWVDKTSAEVKAQLRSYSAGVPSKAEALKEKAGKQKSASAKKAPAVKAVKKKS